MQALLFALFITSASVVFLLSRQSKPKYSIADAFAAVSWLLLVLLVITFRSQ
ncbi:MAG TPA: hypothetical protein VFJ47_07865 [Terriglobales bacterium]|nr:hypothetical protein [Terriglobales bacterium]